MKTLCATVALASCLLSGLLVQGCAGLQDQPRPAKAAIPSPSATGKPGCFYAREAQSFRVLDWSNLIVFAPNDANAYHVRISPPSPDLRFTETLAFLPTDNRICGYAGEGMLIGTPPRAERVAVVDVSRLSPEGLEALRARSAGETRTVARPQPGPGAEIEGDTARPAAPPAGKADSPAEN